MAKKLTETKVKAEVVKFNPALDCFNGYTDDDLVNSIQNKTMRSAIVKYRNAVAAGQKSAWETAVACARMKLTVREEFESDAALAAFLGLPNKMAFSRLSRIGVFATKAQQLGLATSPCMALLVLASDKYGKLNPEDHLEAIVGMTRDEVVDYTKQYKIAIEDKQNESEPEEQTEQEEQESITSDTDELTEQNTQSAISWHAVLQIRAEVIEVMSDNEYTAFKNALENICSDFNLDPDDVWVG